MGRKTGRKRADRYWNPSRTKCVVVLSDGSLECDHCGATVEPTEGEIRRRHLGDAAARHFRQQCKRPRRDPVGATLIAEMPDLPRLSFRGAWLIQCHAFLTANMCALAAR